MTNLVLIALGVLIAVLTVVTVLDLLPPLRIVPDDTHFDFTRFRRISFPISALLSIVAIIAVLHPRPEFRHRLQGRHADGGAVQVRPGRYRARCARRSSGLSLGDVQLQQFGGPADVLIRVAEQPGGDAAQQAAVQKVRGALGDSVEYRRVEVVGPRVSSELLAYGMLGLMLAIVAILIYLWFRFEWQFALGAMIANVHDIVLTIGFMSITPGRFRPDQYRGAADHSRLFAQRHRRDLRPHPRNAAALQENADAATAQRVRSIRRCRARSSPTSR